MIRKTIFIPILILLLFLIVGLCIYDDFGVTVDEPNQILAGHVIYKYLCKKFGQPVPSPIADVPELANFKNSFYGQAATFPTVLIEALRGFSMDTSTIIHLRHLWNFLIYFSGLCFFTLTIGHIYNSHWSSSLGLLFLIFLPRIFGDIFYNDRDTMLLAWFMISLSAFYWYKLHPDFLRGLICAICFGITVNVRLFGLLLFIFPVVFFHSSKSRKGDILVILTSLCTFLLISPIYWEDPLHSIPTAFIHLSTSQRSLDSNNTAASLFFGRMVNENNLPWYYIPAYILLTTPLVTSLACLIGCCAVIRKIILTNKNGPDAESLIGIGMLVILFPFMLIVMIFRPALYNGWRHFYFLYLPIIWMALEGINTIFNMRYKAVKMGCLVLLAGSFLCSITWMLSAHPYYYIYLNPAFRKQWSGKFTKDYWCLAATDAMKYLLQTVESYPIHIVDHDMVKVNKMSLLPAERDRFHTYRAPVQPYPIEFEYIQYGEYSDSLLDEIDIDYYSPYYKIERDNVLLAEVFQRNHNFEYQGNEIIKNITNSHEDPSVLFITDGDLNTVWNNNNKYADFTIEFYRDFLLTDVEIFPVLQSYDELPAFEFYFSSDGISWKVMNYERKGANGLSFSPIKTSWLKIHVEPDVLGICDMLFHGS